jgi:hypothetical protein
MEALIEIWQMKWIQASHVAPKMNPNQPLGLSLLQTSPYLNA